MQCQSQDNQRLRSNMTPEGLNGSLNNSQMCRLNPTTNKPSYSNANILQTNRNTVQLNIPSRLTLNNQDSNVPTYYNASTSNCNLNALSQKVTTLDEIISTLIDRITNNSYLDTCLYPIIIYWFQH